MMMNVRDRVAFGDLSYPGQQALRRMEAQVGPMDSVALACSLKMSSRDLDCLLAGELKGWIDSLFSDALELRCNRAELESFLGSKAKPVNRTRLELPEKLKPFPWQSRAFQAWKQSHRRGIVEAVTGTGKTHLGVMAIEEAWNDPRRIHPLVVVPTIPVMEQWVQRLEVALPGKRIGRVGNGRFDDFSVPGTAAVVSVINSMVLNEAAKLERLLGFTKKSMAKTLLVADECHRYIEGVVFSKIRAYPFDRTLGLSATVGDDYEIEGLGRIVFEYKFQEAHREGLVPSFGMVNCSVPLTPPERREYIKLNEQCGDALFAVLERHHDLDMNHPGFWKQLKKRMGELGSGDEPLIERLFILYFRRAALTYEAEHKLDLATKLVGQLVNQLGKKVIVFFERINNAIDVEEDLDLKIVERIKRDVPGGKPVRSWVYHSRMNASQRQKTLDGFRESGPSVLFACRCLDEGIDLPDVDGAVLVASTQSSRQRIQRIGRVLRKGDGNKRPIVVTLTVRGTRDEGVTDDDFREFKGVATIAEVHGARQCLAAVAGLAEAN